MNHRVVVVGGGLPGLATALKLQQEGWAVTLLDRGEPGAGASSAALGSLTPFSDHEANAATRALAQRSLVLYEKWVESLQLLSGLPVDYDASGLLEVAINEIEEDALRQTYARLSTSGAPVDYLTGAQAKVLEPHLNDAVRAAILYRTEAMVDISHLIQATVRALKLSGCILVSKVTVRRVLEQHGRLVGIVTSIGPIACDRLVLAPGAFLSEIQGIPHIPLERIRGEVIEVRTPPGMIGRHLYCGDGFMTPRRDGRVFLGSNYDRHEVDDDESDASISVRIAMQSLAATTRIVPALANAQLQRVWKGWRPRTLDSQPVIGWLPIEGVCVAGGFYGLGITLSPVVAEIIAKLFSGQADPDISGLGPERFT